MNNRMSAKEYRKQFIDPVLDDGAMSDEDFQKTLKNSQASYNPKINGSKNKKPRKTEEDDLTKQVADYCELLKAQGKVVVFSHVPSSTFTRSWSVKARNTAMGVRPGVPDMIIVSSNRVLFLELKRLKGGVVSPFQKEWIKSINGLSRDIDKTTTYAHGMAQVVAVVAKGWDEAKEAIDNML